MDINYQKLQIKNRERLLSLRVSHGLTEQEFKTKMLHLKHTIIKDTSGPTSAGENASADSTNAPVSPLKPRRIAITRDVSKVVGTYLNGKSVDEEETSGVTIVINEPSATRNPKEKQVRSQKPYLFIA